MPAGTVFAERQRPGGTKGSYRLTGPQRETPLDHECSSEVSAQVRALIRVHRRRERDEAGQSLVEFSLILFPLFFILLGIIQFGLIFNTYVTMTNAARDAARLGTIYVYTRESGETKATNDLARNESIKTQVLTSMNMLGTTAPYFSTGSTWTQSGNTYTNGDLTITYVLPTGVTDSETRMGQEITVRAAYHQDLIVPIIPLFLPRDTNGRMTLTGEVTMVIN
jgi:Flp pilus assembly protein TadG